MVPTAGRGWSVATDAERAGWLSVTTWDEAIEATGRRRSADRSAGRFLVSCVGGVMSSRLSRFNTRNGLSARLAAGCWSRAASFAWSRRGTAPPGQP